jgi:hypothetical protein
MSAPPDRIWAWGFDNPMDIGQFYDGPCHWMGADAEEYVLASTIPAMIAEAVAREQDVLAQMFELLATATETAGSEIATETFLIAASAIRARKGDAT